MVGDFKSGMLRNAAIQDFIELNHILVLRDFIGAELEQVGVEVLGIEQFEFLFPKEFDKENECNFAGIGGGMKHTFAAENLADGYAVEATHELVVFPHFEAVSQAEAIEFAVGINDFVRDPGVARSECGALLDHCFKFAVDGGFESAFSVESRQVFGYFESMIERYESAHGWGMPIDIIVIIRIGHGKGSREVGLQKKFG